MSVSRDMKMASELVITPVSIWRNRYIDLGKSISFTLSVTDSKPRTYQASHHSQESPKLGLSRFNRLRYERQSFMANV